MNAYIKKLIYLNNISQPKLIPEGLKKYDWRYQIMEVSESALKKELETWSKNKCIIWLSWNDPNGIWTDEDSIEENRPVLTTQTARDYVFHILTREDY